MKRDITPAGSPATGAVDGAFAEVRASFDRFCLAAGIQALGTMMETDVTAACGPRHGRDSARRAHRWGRTRGRIGFHGGKIEVERPRVRGVDGREITIPSWETAAQEDWLGRWAMNLMLINVSTRRFGRAVRLPEGDVPAPSGSGVSKSAVHQKSSYVRPQAKARIPTMSEFVQWLTGMHQCDCGARYNVAVTQVPTGNVICGKCGTLMDCAGNRSLFAYEAHAGRQMTQQAIPSGPTRFGQEIIESKAPSRYSATVDSASGYHHRESVATDRLFLTKGSSICLSLHA